MADTPQEEKNTVRAASRTEYTSGEENCGFTDASYIPRDEAPRLPHIYRYEPPAGKPERESEQKTLAVPFRTVLILCAACVLGGVAAGLAVSERSMIRPEEVAVETIATPVPADRDIAAPTAVPEKENTLSPEELYELTARSVVGIAVQSREKNALGADTRRAVAGTGFLMTEDGYIVTSYETVREAAEKEEELYAVLADGRRVPAELIGTDAGENNIAVLKIGESGLTAVSCGDIHGTEVGCAVYVIGNPLGEMTGTMRQGMVSAPERMIPFAGASEAEAKSPRLFQIDLAGAPGEGAVVFSGHGELLGLMTESVSGTETKGYGFAIPANIAVAAARRIIESSDMPGAPYMGIVVQTVSRTVAEYYNQFNKNSMVVGAQIFSVEEGCCGALAGLCRGDIITKIDDTDITSASGLMAAVNEYRIGDSAEITFYRSGGYMTAKIVFAEKAEG